jgi:hypothetical protein
MRMQFLLKILQACGKLADGGATALLFLMVPFSLVQAYGAYMHDRPWKVALYLFGSCVYLVSALLYNTPTRRWFLMGLGTVIWNLSERSGIRLGRFDHVVFGWMIGSVGKRME